MNSTDTLYQKSTLPELGLVCITASDTVRYRNMTRKYFLKMDESQQQQALRELYSDNLRRLETAIEFCITENIKLYRLTSRLFPFADEPLGSKIIEELVPIIEKIGDRINHSGIRLVLHPDQYVVLSSDKPEVIENSIKILRVHSQILDLLKQPRSPWSAMVIHGGKAQRSERLITTIQQLPPAIRSRLCLENDEYAYGALEILAVCQAAKIPMVFDAHHHIIHENLSTYNDPSVAQMLQAAKSTWSVPEWQLVHISNGSAFFRDKRHSDVITIMPNCYYNAPWIEVEAKLKEVAIAKLRQEWMNTVIPGSREEN